MIKLCCSRPCCSILGMISCSLSPLTSQSQFFGPRSRSGSLVFLLLPDCPFFVGPGRNEALCASSFQGGAVYWQLENLKDAIRVFQFFDPSVIKYSFVYQKVQSSAGSTLMAL